MWAGRRPRLPDLTVSPSRPTRSTTSCRRLTGRKEMGMAGDPPLRGVAMQAGMSHDMGGHGMEPPKPGDVSCSPTWAQPSRDNSRVWVACNKSSEIVEIDTKAWRMVRRFPAGPGVYNLGITHDGTKLIATNKRDA